MEPLWAVLVLVAVVMVVVALVLRRRGERHRVTAGSAASVPVPTSPAVAELRRSGVAEVVARLPVTVDDPDRPSVQRLVRELADQAFASSDRVDHLVVQDREGRHVVTVPRWERPLPPAPVAPERVGADGPPGAPHTRRRAPLAAAPRPVEDTAVRGRTLADRLELPAAVRDQVHRPEDPVDVLRAILAAGGHEVRVADGLLRLEDVAVVVVQDDYGAADALGRAFLRFQRSGARSEIVIHTGHADPAELRRRDALVPQLAYAGPEAIRRMADAVELGLDPLAAARGRPD